MSDGGVGVEGICLHGVGDGNGGGGSVQRSLSTATRSDRGGQRWMEEEMTMAS